MACRQTPSPWVLTRHLSVRVCPNLFLQGHQSDSISTHPKDLILTGFPPGRPDLQIWSYCEVLGLELQRMDLGDTSSPYTQALAQHLTGWAQGPHNVLKFLYVCLIGWTVEGRVGGRSHDCESPSSPSEQCTWEPGEDADEIQASPPPAGLKQKGKSGTQGPNTQLWKQG